MQAKTFLQLSVSIRTLYARRTRVESVVVSGSALNTRAFQLDEILAEVNNINEGLHDMDPEIWGMDPYDADELTDLELEEIGNATGKRFVVYHFGEVQ
jgi:hypothetical protein